MYSEILVDAQVLQARSGCQVRIPESQKKQNESEKSIKSFMIISKHFYNSLNTLNIRAAHK